jgi:hypothetical protein
MNVIYISQLHFQVLEHRQFSSSWWLKSTAGRHDVSYKLFPDSLSYSSLERCELGPGIYKSIVFSTHIVFQP